MREREYQRRIEDMLDRFGWKWRHVPAPMRWDSKKKAFVPAAEAAGLCDILATHHDPPRLLFMEVKGDRGKLSEAQRDFLHSIKIVAEVAVDQSDMDIADPFSAPHLIGVVAVWPGDEAQVEQMLRTRVMQ